MKHTSRIAAACFMVIGAAGCSMFARNKPADPSDAPATRVAAPAGVATQQPDDKDFVKSPDGLDYKIVTKGSGAVTPKVGDFAEMHVRFCIGDTVMINTFEMNDGQPVMQPIQEPSIQGDLMEGLLRMKAGDSVVFRMLMDTLAVRANQPKPHWAKPGDYAVWEVKMVDVKTKEQVERESAAREQQQKTTDDKLLQDYFRTKKIANVKKTASGLYYTVQKPGAGISPKAGQSVTVNYSGQTLEGVKFDSNVDPAFRHVEPFSFALGKRNVIRGWDEGVALMKKGMKATFYIPSWMAYGDKSPGPNIPANAILVFEIELLGFK